MLRALAEVERTVKPALEKEDFAGAMQAFAGLRAPIDAFFDKVTVNVAGQARPAPEQAEIAQPNSCHHGLGGGFFEDRGLTMAKWVYSFGNGKAEGRAEMRNLLGGKGANLAEMSSLGLPVPPGFTVTTEVCTYYYANNESYPPELKDEVEAALAAVEKTVGRRLRRRQQSAARLGPLRRARLDAGHDGHRPEPRPQRPHGAGARQVVGRRALRLGQLSPLHPDVLQRRARRRPPLFRGGARAQEGGSRRPHGHRPQVRRLARGRRPSTRRSSRSAPASRSRRSRASSSGARSARCSARG